jgi:hypothetical protein
MATELLSQLAELSIAYTPVLLGAMGGLVRALFGSMKSIERGEPIARWYFLLTVLIAAFIGGALGNVFGADYRVAGITGFVGTDILENITKASFGRNLVLRKS